MIVLKKFIIFLMLNAFATHCFAARSCGSYVKNGKTHYIPCSLGRPLTTKTSVSSACKAELKINGVLIRIRHQCIVKPSGKTGAQTVSKPSGEFEKRQNEMKNLINELAKKHQVDASLVHAVITVESAYRSEVVSNKGAIGLMQLMPTTASALNVNDPFDPALNIDGGVRYLRQMLTYFNGNEALALAAYNAGPEAVKKYHYTIPPYPETQNYVNRVLAYRGHYQNEWKMHIQ